MSIISAKKTITHMGSYYFIVKTSGSSVSHVFARADIIGGWVERDVDYNILELEEEDNNRVFRVIVRSINGYATELRISPSSGLDWTFELEDENNESSDDIIVSKEGSVIRVERIPHENYREEYPTPTIGNIYNNSAALLFFPVRRFNESWENNNSSDSEPTHFALMQKGRIGRVSFLKTDLETAEIQVLQPDYDNFSLEEAYEAVPVGVTLSGGGIAKKDTGYFYAINMEQYL